MHPGAEDKLENLLLLVVVEADAGGGEKFHCCVTNGFVESLLLSSLSKLGESNC